ncbi:hypothetical protein [Zemynaea arenosa]|uniref:hypothetical protein n=1 Tax=Zemynaea arenosa TaxID=2561931 RepID=UPI00143126DF|nr:hypothetical protein [Massilia arenosa]
MKSSATHRSLVASYLAGLAGLPAPVPQPVRVARSAQVKAQLLRMMKQRKALKQG